MDGAKICPFRSIALITHLTELHVGESLTQHAEGVRIRSLLMQTDLENAAQAVLQMKTLLESRNPAPSERDPENGEMEMLFQRADAIISQIRSAKVVCSKAIHQVEELNSRSLTLGPSALSIVEETQSVVSDLASVINLSGLSLINYLGTDDTVPITYAQIIDIVSPGDALPFASLYSKVQQTIPSLQIFYALTNNLSQTVELPETASSIPPWELLARKLHAENAVFVQYKQDAIRLQAEVHEKNTSLAMKEKTLEEMMVKMEVLEKRMGDSGGRRERVRELEGAVELAQSKTRDLVSKAERLEHDLKAAEAERENLRKQVTDISPRTDVNNVPKSTSREKEVTPTRALEEIERLKSEILILQSTIRHLRLSAHQADISSAHSFLSTPLISKHKLSSAVLRSQEAHDVLNSMLQLVTHPQSQVVQLRSRPREERLGWRPMRDSPAWQVSGQKEQWAGWKEWRDDVGQQMGQLQRGQEKRRVPPSSTGRQPEILDGKHTRLDSIIGKESTGEVAVVGSTDYQGRLEMGLS